LGTAIESSRPSQVTGWRFALPAEAVHRLIDVLVSGAASAITWPVLVVAAVMIRLETPGPVIFRQKRMGRHNRPFTIYKLRTMKWGTPDVAKSSLSARDSRITRVGAFLRCTSLDELPQFFNVLRGDMSVVGPRPALWNQHDLIAMRIQAGVHRLKPGLTGLAQIYGREELPPERKVALEAYYARIRSPMTDLAIILATLRAVFSGRGAY